MYWVDSNNSVFIRVLGKHESDSRSVVSLSVVPVSTHGCEMYYSTLVQNLGE